MTRPVALVLLATVGACSAPSQPEVESIAYVWRVARGDVVERGNAVARNVGLPPLVRDDTGLVSEAPGGRLRVDYATGRMTYYPSDPSAVAIADDNDAIDRAAQILFDAGLIPAGNDRCLCAAGLIERTDPRCAGVDRASGAASAWKQCPTLAVRAFGIVSDLVPPGDDGEALMAPPGVSSAGEGGGAIEAPIEIAFTPRLPIVRRVDGTDVLGELAAGGADQIVRFTAAGAFAGFDARYQPVADPPIEVTLRSFTDAAPELADPGDDAFPALDAWQLGFLATSLGGADHHGNWHPHPLHYYYPMYLRTAEATNVAVRAVTASYFLPRIGDINIPPKFDADVDPPLAVWFDAAYGLERPMVSWYVQDPIRGRMLLETTASEPDPDRPGLLRSVLHKPPPEGQSFLTVAVSDRGGPHYELEDIDVDVTNSDTELDQLRNTHGAGSWAPSGAAGWRHSNDIYVTPQCLDGNCETGPFGVKIEMGAAPFNAPRWADVFARDMAVMQFHVDLKLRLPERKRNLQNGWGEDWPRPGDPDAIYEDGVHYKDFWIRTDTCKLDSPGVYACDVVPNSQRTPSDNPHRKLGMKCPRSYDAQSKEQGDEDDKRCTSPTRVPNAIEARRVFTGMPGRLTMTLRYEVTEEASGDAVVSAINIAQGTVLSMIRDDLNHDPTNRTAAMLRRIGQLETAVRPVLRWVWQGDQPRARPEDMKRYGGMQVECYNALEFCRHANQYDPRPLPWNHNGAVQRPPYVEATRAVMQRPWEEGMQASAPMPANDRHEGEQRAYCEHELYKVLKERFCPCPDNGDPCEQTGGSGEVRPNPMITVREVRLTAYHRVTPFERGNGGMILISELKNLPERLLGLEAHKGTKLESAIPPMLFLSQPLRTARSLARWVGLVFGGVLGAWAGNAALNSLIKSLDEFNDWIDVFHWYEWVDAMPVVRPLSTIEGLAPVLQGKNAHYFAPLGVFPQWTFTAPPIPPMVWSWGDKNKYGLRKWAVTQVPVPAGFDQKGLWQNLHFKSTSPDGSATRFTDIVVPGCQSVFPIRFVAGGGGWFWTWDRNLCLHHHESWFNLNPKQINHDIGWMVGVRPAQGNPSRVGNVIPGTTMWTPTTGRNRTGREIVFWEFTVGRNNTNTEMSTFNTEFFFTFGPTAW